MSADIGFGDQADQQELDELLLRKALFKQIEAPLGGKVLAVEAYFEGLSIAGAKGEVGANRVKREIEAHRRRQTELAMSRVEVNTSPIAASKRQCEANRWIGNLLCGVLYGPIYAKLCAEYEPTHGPIELRSALVPYGLDLAPAAAVIAGVRQRMAREAPKHSYDIGYGKPPISNRFTKDNNPSSKRKSLKSPWDQLDKSFRKPVVIAKANGTRYNSTRHECSYDQLIKKATLGDRIATAEVARLIMELDRKGKFSAPPPARRRRRKPLPEGMRDRLEEVLPKIKANLERDVRALFERHYSPNGEIVDYEAGIGTDEAHVTVSQSGQTDASRGSGEECNALIGDDPASGITGVPDSENQFPPVRQRTRAGATRRTDAQPLLAGHGKKPEKSCRRTVAPHAADGPPARRNRTSPQNEGPD